MKEYKTIATNFDEATFEEHDAELNEAAKEGFVCLGNERYAKTSEGVKWAMQRMVRDIPDAKSEQHEYPLGLVLPESQQAEKPQPCKFNGKPTPPSPEQVWYLQILDADETTGETIYTDRWVLASDAGPSDEGILSYQSEALAIEAAEEQLQGHGICCRPVRVK